MSTIIVWLLITTSANGYNYGNVTVVGKFLTAGDCQWVKQHMQQDDVDIRCIQARIIVP